MDIETERFYIDQYIQTGDNIYIESLYEEINPVLEKNLSAYISDVNLLQEIIEETWAKWLQNVRRLEGSLTAWLTIMGRNLLRDKLKKKSPLIIKDFEEFAVYKPKQTESALSVKEQKILEFLGDDIGLLKPDLSREYPGLPEELWNLKSMLDDGYSNSEIGLQYNLSAIQMTRLLGKARKNYPEQFRRRKKKSLKAYQREALLAAKMWERDYKLEDIAFYYGISPDALMSRIVKWRKIFPEWFSLRFQEKEVDILKQDAMIAQRMWAKGQSVKEIAEVYGVSLSTMRGRIERWRKVEPSWFKIRKKKPAKDFSLAHKLWEAGASVKEIAVKYDIPVSTVKSRMASARKKDPTLFPARRGWKRKQ